MAVVLLLTSKPHSLQLVNVPSTNTTTNSLSKDFCANFPRIPKNYASHLNSEKHKNKDKMHSDDNIFWLYFVSVVDYFDVVCDNHVGKSVKLWYYDV